MREQKRIIRIGWIMGVFLAGMLSTAPGATITWVGSVSSNWADPFNWSPTNAVPGTNDEAAVSTSAANVCVIPSNTTQSVWIIRINGTDPVTYGKLILKPGAVLNGLRPASSEGPLYFGLGANNRGYFEIQSNATFNTPYATYMAMGGWGIPCQMTVAVNGGSFPVVSSLNDMQMGTANGTLSAVYTGAVYVSNGGFVSCRNMGLGYGAGWYANEVGRGVLTISNEGSLFQCSGDSIAGRELKALTRVVAAARSPSMAAR